jgi:hypothetical protein
LPARVLDAWINMIETSVSGIRISEHFPRFAKLMQHVAVLRGMSTLESDRKLATYHLHTGYRSGAGAVPYPSLGAIVAKELGKRDVALPNFVTIGRGPQEALTAGFLGPDYQPLAVNDPLRGPDFIEPAAAPTQFGRQMRLLEEFEDSFRDTYHSAAGDAHRSSIDRAMPLMNSEQKQAFDLAEPPGALPLRQQSAACSNGQRVVLAQRVLERGVARPKGVSGPVPLRHPAAREPDGRDRQRPQRRPGRGGNVQRQPCGHSVHAPLRRPRAIDRRRTAR